ncbi:MAG: RNA polymerase sigma-70 factor [Flavisolibacter sp.]
MRSDNLQKGKQSVNSVGNSEEEVFNQLFRKYFPPLTWFAQSIVGDLESAKDLVEDSFVKFWERREILSRPGNIKSYLYTSVHHTCIDFLRKQKRISLHQSQITLLQESEERPVFYQIIAAETLNEIITALNYLPPKCSLVFKMYYLQGKTLDKIASELRLSVSTIKSQKGRALNLLKKRLSGLTLISVLLIRLLLWN